MYTVYVAGNYLVKFALITDLHLLESNWQGWSRRKNISQKALLHFLIN